MDSNHKEGGGGEKPNIPRDNHFGSPQLGSSRPPMAILKKCPKARILSEEIRLVRIDENPGLFRGGVERERGEGGGAGRGRWRGEWSGGGERGVERGRGVEAEKDLIDRIP